MNFKITEISAISIIILLITVGIIYTTRLVELNNTLPEVSYEKMTTEILQEEVEKLSQNGELPFPMGRELIQRWTRK